MAYVPHKNGRPTRADGPTRSRSIRFTHDEDEALEAHAAKKGLTFAELVREKLKRAGAFKMPERA